MSAGFVLEHVLAGGDRAGPLARRRIYIFPTRQGILYGAVLLVMLIGAINYSNSMAYLLAFTLGSVFLVCMLHTFRNLRGLILNIKPAPPVFAGSEARFPVLIDNRSGAERISISLHPAPVRRGLLRWEAGEAHYLDIPATQLLQDAVAVPARSRGILQAGRLRITTTWPLGLFRAWSYVTSDAECVVYPRPGGSRAVPERVVDAPEYQLGNKAGTDDFVGFRPYRPGDSIRNIDWKVLAREQGVVIKRFSGSGMRRMLLHWEHTAHLGDTERRLSQLCLWVLEAERQGINYGLVLPGAELPVAHGEAHKHRCLKVLATHGLAGHA